MNSVYRCLVIVLLGLMVAACTAPPLRLAPVRELEASEDDVVDKRELVVLVNTADAAVWLDTQAFTRGYRLKAQTGLGALGTIMMIFEIPAGLEGTAAIRELERLEPGAVAGVNHRYGYVGSASAYAARRQETIERRAYASRLIGWPADGCPAQMAVGMIDAPVDPNADALQGVRLRQASFSSGSVPAEDWHGTAVAELIAGAGRLRGTELYSASVIGVDSEGRPSAGVDGILRALDWLKRQGAQVANISLAGPYNKILDTGIQMVARDGMIIVAATGNGGPSSSLKYPAAFPEVIAVTAVDARGAVYAKAVHGSHIDVAAPGVDVFVAADGGGRYLTGTSFAAPFVTARIAAAAPAGGATVDEVRAQLSASSQDLGAAGRDPVYGAGLVTTPSACR